MTREMRMTRQCAAVGVAVIAVGFFAPPAWTQSDLTAEKSTGEVTGRLLSQGRPLGGTTIGLAISMPPEQKGDAPGVMEAGKLWMATAADGTFHFKGVPANTYWLAFPLGGNIPRPPKLLKQVVVTPGKTVVLGDVPVDSSESGKPSTPAMAARILNDAGLFRADFAKEVMGHAKTFEAMISTNAFLHWPVPAPAPSIRNVEAKYGKADRRSQVRNQTFEDGKKRDATIYWYGRFGLTVAAGNPDGIVEWVAFE